MKFINENKLDPAELFVRLDQNKNNGIERFELNTKPRRFKHSDTGILLPTIKMQVEASITMNTQVCHGFLNGQNNVVKSYLIELMLMVMASLVSLR